MIDLKKLEWDKNRIQIDGFYAEALFITLSNEDGREELFLTNNEPAETIEVGFDYVKGELKEYILYLERSSVDTVIENILAFPIHPAFNLTETTGLPIEENNNEASTFALTPRGEKIMTTDINNLIGKINNEAIRRDKSGSSGNITKRASNVSVGQTITANSYNDTASPLTQALGSSNINISAGSKIMATGTGSYYYLSTLADSLASIKTVTTSSHGCNANCSGLCYQVCYTSCGTNCSKNCADGCSGNCGTTCQKSCGGCGNTCSAECRSACQIDCSSTCDETCMETDFRACGSDCTYQEFGGDCC